VHAPLGAVGTVGGPAEREQAPGGALLLGVGELLAAQVIDELLGGELVHEDLSFLSWPRWARDVLYCRQPPGRSPYVAAHRRGTGWAQD
jgi:hypothetical protein